MKPCSGFKFVALLIGSGSSGSSSLAFHSVTDALTEQTEILENSETAEPITTKTSTEVQNTTQDKIQFLSKILTCCELGQDCCNLNLLSELRTTEKPKSRKQNEIGK